MVSIVPLDKIGADERGSTYTFDNDRTGQFIVALRKAGSQSGGNYHTGVHPYKNPEKLVIMQGDCKLYWANLAGTEAGIIMVAGPAQIIIPANVWHKLVGVTDFVMLELNGLDAGVGDTLVVS